MPFVYENVKVELFPGTPSPIVHLSENDVGDTIVFELVYKGQPVNIPGGSIFKFKGTKKDGLGFTVNSSNVSGNVVSFVVSQDMTSCSGVVEAEISITLSNNKHGTCNVVLIVEKNPHLDGTQDGSYPQIVSEMRALVNRIEGDAETASNAANTAVAAKNSALEIQQDVHQYAASVIDDWLDNHPEATTTVQDGAITEVKFSDALKLKTIKDYVTPEMFGAVGDGVADDTQAWQSAVNSGKKVIATKSTYKCGKITVNTDVEIDCANASFICTENILFDCSGSVADSVSGSDYSAWQTDYNIGDSYTGLAMLKGTNNVFKARNYYYGGFVCDCVDGTIKNSYPIDVSNVTIEEIDSITVYIRNIANVTFGNVNGSKVVRLYYNKNSIVENVAQSDECLSVVSIESSYGCLVRNCNIIQLVLTAESGFSYPIEIIDSSYNIVENCKINNNKWHCITTGGNYLCYFNTVRDCVLHSSNGIDAYHDHDNGIGTKIYNSEITTMTIGALSEVEDCTVLPCGGTYKESSIRLQATDDANIASYNIKDCLIICDSTGNAGYFGIAMYITPQTSGNEYYIRNILLDNVLCSGALIGRIAKRGSTSITIDTLDVSGINMLVILNVTNVFFKKLKKYDSTHYPTIGATGYTIENVIGSDSFFSNIVGIVSNVYLHNCISKVTTYNNTTAKLQATNCNLLLLKAVMMSGVIFAKNCIINNSAAPFDVVGISGVGYYGNYTVNGYTVTQIT